MKIFIFGLVIAFFIFKIGYWSDAYGNSVTRDESTMIGAGDISSKECLEVLMKGNFIPQNDNHYGKVFYKGHEYLIQQYKMDGNIKYTCHAKTKLIPSNP